MYHLLRLPEGPGDADLSYDEFLFSTLMRTTRIMLPNVENAFRLWCVFTISGNYDETNPEADPTRIVAQSMTSGNPIMVVTVNYLLNLFAFEDQSCMNGLALRDQILAIELAVRNVDEFDGDPASDALCACLLGKASRSMLTGSAGQNHVGREECWRRLCPHPYIPRCASTSRSPRFGLSASVTPNSHRDY
ncbi:hypothetical protein E5D57_011046 [Metarhizium anisopliae]|nr:hypothetical protein E5D57_011046 [Metarhizium anisopliae]